MYTAGVDFIEVRDVHTFPTGSRPGAVEISIIQIVDDPFPESTETFGVHATVVNGRAVLIPPYDHAVIEITDDDSGKDPRLGQTIMLPLYYSAAMHSTSVIPSL